MLAPFGKGAGDEKIEASAVVCGAKEDPAEERLLDQLYPPGGGCQAHAPSRSQTPRSIGTP